MNPSLLLNCLFVVAAPADRSRRDISMRAFSGYPRRRE